jgi:ATP-binding cassette subfamily B protein
VIPILGALALGAQRLLPFLQQAYSSWTTIRGTQASLKDILTLLDQPIPSHDKNKISYPLNFKKNITIENLGFRYNLQSAYVLKELNLTIEKGSCVGFIGTTGSGKSTLLDILMGLLEPTNGHLKIDGQIISSNNNHAWQYHIAHVPQNIFLADSSIEENIAFGLPKKEIDKNRVKEAAQLAQLSSVIEALPDQYQTIVGERGIRLSGGQRQRIGIARAFYKKADIMIFDEATSSLDTETEQAVMKAIQNYSKNLTLLIIAHRLSTLENCTKIVELDNGRIKRIGLYSDIVGLKDDFKIN